MSGKNNIQDLVLNKARKDKAELTIYLTNGVPLKGKVISFDNFTIILDTNGKQSLIYKHAISTIISQRPGSLLGAERIDDKENSKENSKENTTAENTKGNINENSTEAGKTEIKAPQANT